MNQRKTVVQNRRPSGTDGSDFSYRMVVDSRYKKVAEGKSRLRVLIPVQGFIQFIVAAVLFLCMFKGETVDSFAVSSVVIFFISLLIGELGRSRSRVNFLKVYVFGSSVSSLISVVYLLKRDQFLETLKDLNLWEASKLEVLNAASILFGVIVQIFAVDLVSSLVGNMAPPKRAS